MNTPQLIVFCYAGLALTGILLYRAWVEDSSSAYVIGAVVVLAALLIYFFKPHPLARKRLVAATVVLPLTVGGLAAYGWVRYTEYKNWQEGLLTMPVFDLVQAPDGVAIPALMKRYPELLPNRLYAAQAIEELRALSARAKLAAPAAATQVATGRSSGTPAYDLSRIPADQREAFQGWVQRNIGHPNLPKDTGAAYLVYQEVLRVSGDGQQGGSDQEEQQSKQRAAREAEEQAWIAGRFKLGDRVSAINDGDLEIMSGLYGSKPKPPRLHGTVMDVEFDPKSPRSERYAVKWDGGNVVWINGRGQLHRVTPKGE